MKQKKRTYIIGGIAAAILIALLITNRDSARQIPAMLISVAVGVGLMLAVLFAALFLVNRNRRREAAFRANAVQLTGRVTKVGKMPVKQRGETIYSPGQDLYILVAQYDYQGKRYTGAKRSYFGKPPFEVGDPIIVYVDPRDPGKSKILGDGEETTEKTTV